MAPFLRNLVAGAWATVRAEPLGFVALVAVATLIGRQLAARRREGPPPEG